ncbi:hypothetical protein E2C01_059714 [Portunus trituberculatus]|uniref:Uncharacterized protein n=1 Tax=Portunus trituberculatus TaxID=210409 RepID=A0A5B7H6L1_PORTR|nr:hypothetical protein [Portunus trituberculatus]
MACLALSTLTLTQPHAPTCMTMKPPPTPPPMTRTPFLLPPSIYLSLLPKHPFYPPTSVLVLSLSVLYLSDYPSSPTV